MPRRCMRWSEISLAISWGPAGRPARAKALPTSMLSSASVGESFAGICPSLRKLDGCGGGGRGGGGGIGCVGGDFRYAKMPVGDLLEGVSGGQDRRLPEGRAGELHRQRHA